MKMYLLWILMFVIARLILTAIQTLFRKKEFKTRTHIIFIIVKLLCSVAFAALVMAGPVFLRPVQPVLIALYAVLFADALADICYTVFKAAKKTDRRFSHYQIMSLIFCILFFAYGTVNMQIIRPNYHTYTSEKLKEEHKFVFVSDIHVGGGQNFSTVEKMVENIYAQSPDFIILGGDVTDDFTTKEEMSETYALFKDSDIPVYFIYGNHEVQQHPEYSGGANFSQDEIREAIESNGIEILVDEFEEISDDLILLGRNDVTAGENRLSAEELKNPSPEKYLVTADHQPVDIKENIKTGTDLQVSGHTHAGQLFPLRLLYSLLAPVYGDYEYEGGVIMNVSSGSCGWREPFRTDSHCHFEVIELKPAE